MSPTWARTTSFGQDYAKLTPAERAAFVRAVHKFVEDLRRGEGFRSGLRVKRVQGTDDIWEMTWADDGRATFQYGEELAEGEPHIIWRAIGGHEVFRNP